MLRTVITPTETNISLPIPEEYVGKPLEVTLVSVQDKMEAGKKTMGDFWGVLSDVKPPKIYTNRLIKAETNGRIPVRYQCSD